MLRPRGEQLGLFERVLAIGAELLLYCIKLCLLFKAVNRILLICDLSVLVGDYSCLFEVVFLHLLVLFLQFLA